MLFNDLNVIVIPEVKSGITLIPGTIQEKFTAAKPFVDEINLEFLQTPFTFTESETEVNLLAEYLSNDERPIAVSCIMGSGLRR